MLCCNLRNTSDDPIIRECDTCDHQGGWGGSNIGRTKAQTHADTQAPASMRFVRQTSKTQNCWRTCKFGYQGFVYQGFDGRFPAYAAWTTLQITGARPTPRLSRRCASPNTPESHTAAV